MLQHHYLTPLLSIAPIKFHSLALSISFAFSNVVARRCAARCLDNWWNVYVTRNSPLQEACCEEVCAVHAQ